MTVPILTCILHPSSLLPVFQGLSLGSVFEGAIIKAALGCVAADLVPKHMKKNLVH